MPLVRLYGEGTAVECGHIYQLLVYVVAAVPYLLAPLENVNTLEDTNVTFSCMAAGIPQPTVTWYSGSRLLEGL